MMVRRALGCALAVMLVVSGGQAAAETIVAARTIRSGEILSAGDVKPAEGAALAARTEVERLIGLEARRTIFAGRPVTDADLGPPALIERNEVVTLIYRKGPLAISTEGRALDRAGLGDRVRVISLSSRQTVQGIVRSDGTVLVGSR